MNSPLDSATTAVAAAQPQVSLPTLIKREQQRRRRRMMVWIGLVVVVALGVTAAVVLTRPKPVPMAARFRTAHVITGDLVREVRATGYVEAVSTVSVGAEISGRVSTVEVDFNQAVKAGQVLARFDMASLEAQRAQGVALTLSSKAQAAQARFDLEQARRNRSRADALFAQQAMTVTDHETAVTAVSIAEARAAAAEANFAAQTAIATVSKTNLEHAVIRSPIDGVIITRNIDPGQTVASALTTPVLFTVAADLRKMQVLASVDEADISQVAVGQPAEFSVTAWPGRIFKGTVSEVRNAARVVQDVVTYGAVIDVENLDLALKPGMTALVRVRTGSVTAALQVPTAALRFTPPGEKKVDEHRVWVLENDVPAAKSVTPGLSDGEQTAITAGEVSTSSSVLVDLTTEGKKAYGLVSR